MGGEIGVKSEVGVGSTFWFTAHFGLAEKTSVPDQRVLEKELKGLNVLVVDDNPTARLIMQRYLDSFGYKVSLATSGEQAIDLVETARQPFDLVLMDWKMPQMDGVEATRRIKSNDKLKHMPAVMMVTAFDREQLHEQIAGLGLNGVLVKPVSQSSLFDGILSAFGKGQMAQQHHGPKIAEHIRGARILLVEDNDINQQVADELLTQAGLYVSIAEDGKQGVEQAAKGDADGHAFDAILMDIQMPVMDGYTASRILRKDPQFKTLPIIAMTANAMVSDKEQAAAAGMNDHIAKPIDIQQLFEVLAKWVNVPEARRVGQTQESPAEKQALSATQVVNIPRLSGIDTVSGLNRVGGNQALYLKILKKFSASQADVITRIQHAPDAKTALREAHTLKGLAGNIGADDLQQAAAKVETLLKGNEGERSDALLELETILNAVLGALQAVVVPDLPAGELAAVEPSQSQLATACKHLSELRRLLEDDDAAASQPLDQLHDLLAGSKYQPTLKRMASAVDDYEFERALEVLAILQPDVEKAASSPSMGQD
jgi:CheY-like chemotaxis protein